MVETDDKGNEVTGQITLWLLVSANLTELLSISIKGIYRLHISSAPFLIMLFLIVTGI